MSQCLVRRRIDRVLAPGYLDGLQSLPLDEVRELRRDAEQEEADLYFVRRLLQDASASCGPSRIAAPDAARSGGWSTRWPKSSPINPPADPHLAATRPPSRPGEREYRRNGERMVADVEFSDVTARTEAELGRALASLTARGESVSRSRPAVQRVADACRVEVAPSYGPARRESPGLLTGPARADRGGMTHSAATVPV